MSRYNYDRRAALDPDESEDWLVVTSMDLPSWDGGPKVFPAPQMTTSGSKEVAQKVFDERRRRFKGPPGSHDALSLVYFNRKVSIPKQGWDGTLRDFLRRYHGLIWESIGSSFR